MVFVDIHTHRHEPPREGRIAVVSCSPGDDLGAWRHCSVGIHPWQAGEGWESGFERLETACRGRNVVAIGECGLDRLRGGSWAQQTACFEAQIELARRMGLPLIVHCVKALDDVLRMCQGVPCIFHGFRGKPQQAQTLINRGFDLSFGPNFNPESLRLAAAVGRMWLETDDGPDPIERVYERAATALGIKPEGIALPTTLSFSED